jgi:hypothetical protein
MDKAFNNLSQTPLRPNSPFIPNGPALMLSVLARQAAIAHTKLQLKRQGHRVSQYSHREILCKADAYLDANRTQLIAETHQRIMASPGLRQMWEKAKTKYERQLAAQAKREGKRASAVGQRTTKNPTVTREPMSKC